MMISWFKFVGLSIALFVLAQVLLMPDNGIIAHGPWTPMALTCIGLGLCKTARNTTKPARTDPNT